MPTLIPKSESALCKAIDTVLKVLSFGKLNRFMDDYVTTIGDTIYTPLSWNDWGVNTQQEVLSHEMVHIEQQKRHGKLLFALLYLFAPLPILFANWRLEFEMEAYAQTCLHKFQTGGPVRQSTVNWIVEQMTGPSYLWTTIDAKKAEQLLRQKVKQITSQNIFAAGGQE